jgi:hypothetical protein
MADGFSKGKLWGLLAQYEDPHAIYKACEKVRDSGYSAWDACVPFPVHGLDKAMGLKPSKLPWVVLCVGIAGSALMLLFEIWTQGTSYPIVVGGKPLFSIPAFVPVWYEITVLSSCVTAFLGNWILSGLPRPHHPAFNSKRFERVTDDKFFILVEATDPKFSLEQTRALLTQAGASSVEELEN